jgi:hypothetical protein
VPAAGTAVGPIPLPAYLAHRLREKAWPDLAALEGRLALDTSSQVDFMHGLTYPPDNMPGSCIAGSKYRFGIGLLWHAFDAAHESCPDLS